MIWRQSGSPHAVIDVKYKAPRPTGMANADAYQMFAYCTALGLSQGFLVYAKNSGEQIRILTIKNTGCEIRVRTLDVERSAEQLIQQVAMSPMRSRLGAQRQSPPLPEAQRGAPTLAAGEGRRRAPDRVSSCNRNTVGARSYATAAAKDT